MKTETVSPVAARVIEKCGGYKAVALITGAALSAVYRWTYPKSKGGRGGEIPREPRDKLVEAARAGLVNLVASDFVDLPAAPRKRSAEVMKDRVTARTLCKTTTLARAHCPEPVPAQDLPHNVRLP